MTTPHLGVPPQSDSEPSGSRISAPSEQDIQRPTMPAITPDGPSTDRPPTVLKFGSGRSVIATENGGEEQIEIRSSGGGVLLSMRLTADGPVLSLSAASVEIAAAKTLSLRAETLSIAAEKDLTIEAGGSLLQKVAGHAERQVGGTDRVRACDIEMTAHPGGASIRANDDVDIVGERVRLNSDDPPMPQTWEEHSARHALMIQAVSPEPVLEQGDEEAAVS